MSMGFREVPHTADWELEVWGPDLPALLEQAARGMCALAGVRLAPAGRITRSLELQAADPESLLVSFLSELLFFGWQENLGFDTFELELDDLHLNASLQGAPIAEQAKEIKAVTYHKLAIQPGPRGLAAHIVFDV